MNEETQKQETPNFTAEEKAAMRGSLATLLADARSNLSIGNSYIAKARATATTASVLLKAFGVRRTPDELLALLADRKGVFVAEDYAKLAADELIPEADKGVEAAENA
jgi:hypothetical protein